MRLVKRKLKNQIVGKYLVNQDLSIWNYSNMPLNIDGQICLPFTLIWCVISVIVVVLAILAFVAYRSCGSDQEKESEPTNTIVSDSTEKEKPDTASNVKKTTAPETEQEQNNVGENTDAASATPTNSDDSTKQTTAPVSTSNSSVEEKAMQVWDGVYGNGTERKSKLGSDYKAVQKRVNEMYRNGYRR